MKTVTSVIARKPFFAAIRKKLLMATFGATAMGFFIFGCRDTPPGPPPPPNGPDTTSHVITWQTDSLGYYFGLLKDVWGMTTTNIYAVGYIPEQPPQIGSFILHFDGLEWTKVRDDSLLFWIAVEFCTGFLGFQTRQSFWPESEITGME